ncbi:tRNA cyclic N6-threonylcarbamoyladenosine(37) synthase TcdA, partial [Escherichia coli]
MQTKLSDAWMQRFAGIGRLYGQHALSLFARSHVCVIGV